MHFLFVGWDFASGFLQIPSHDGHPCLQLTVPTAKPVVDFHHQVITHAGRTNTGASPKAGTARGSVISQLLKNFLYAFK
jgi:hypothetical protein